VLTPRLGLRGDTLVRVAGPVVEVCRVDSGGAHPVDRFEVDGEVAWLAIAPDGDGVLIRDTSYQRAWQWRRGRGLAPLVATDSVRDRFGCGYLVLEGRLVVLVARGESLRGLDPAGELVLEVALPPRRFMPRAFHALPGDRLALLGREPSVPFDRLVTVAVTDLARERGCVVAALSQPGPLSDTAVHLAVGPGPGDSAVVYRDPDGDEELDEDDDEDDDDVFGFTGFYLRELSGGRLIQRLPFAGGLGGDLDLCATERAIVVAARGQVLSIDRATGVETAITGAAVALDRDRGRVARVDRAGHLDLFELGGV